MLKLKLQYFGHLMLGKIEGKRRRGQQRMRWLGSLTNTITIKLVDMNWSKLGETVENRGAAEPGLLWFMGLHRVWYDSANEQQQHQYSHPQGIHPLVISHHPKPLPPPIHIYPTNACSILYPQALTTIISAKKKKKNHCFQEKVSVHDLLQSWAVIEWEIWPQPGINYHDPRFESSSHLVAGEWHAYYLKIYSKSVKSMFFFPSYLCQSLSSVPCLFRPIPLQEGRAEKRNCLTTTPTVGP